MDSELSITEIMALDLQTAYQLFKQIELQEQKPKNYSQLYEYVRYGIEEEFDIYSLFDNEFTPKTKSGEIIIEGRTIKKKDFNTEIENREALIKKTIIDNQTDDSPYKNRK